MIVVTMEFQRTFPDSYTEEQAAEATIEALRQQLDEDGGTYIFNIKEIDEEDGPELFRDGEPEDLPWSS